MSSGVGVMKQRVMAGLPAIGFLVLAACGGGAHSTTGDVSEAVTDTAAAPSCDRDCLNTLVDSYLAALVAGDPSAVPLAEDIAFVENVTRMQPGEGLWQTASVAPTSFRVYVPDVVRQQAGFMGVMQREAEDGDQNVMFALRLKLEDGEIAEAEHIIAGVNGMQRLETPRPGLVTEVPAGSRQNYDDLVAIGLSYYDALDDNDGSLMPFAEDCQRHENGMVTAGPEAGPGPNADPDLPPVARLCGPQLDSQSFTYIDRIENRRLIAADPVTGLALGFSHFRHPFDNLPYLVYHVDGSTSERNSENFSFNPFDMPAAHVFKIGADGLVHEIEAVGFSAPYNSQTGWE